MMMMMMMNWFCSIVELTNKRHLALFPAWTIVRDPHHRKYPTCCEQDLNLRRILVQALLNKVMQWTTTRQRHDYYVILLPGNFETWMTLLPTCKQIPLNISFTFKQKIINGKISLIDAWMMKNGNSFETFIHRT